MTSKRLSPDQVHAVGMAAIGQALELMGDARELNATGSPRSAYALGVIAVEELWKFMQCRQLLKEWKRPVTVKELNALLRPKNKTHTTRYADVLRYLMVLAPDSWIGAPPAEEMAAVDMQARERVLCVSVAASGTPMTAGVPEDEARVWVEGMVGIFGTLQSAWHASLEEALSAASADGSVT